MTGEQRTRVLAAMDEEDADVMRRLLSYEEGTAGSLMTPDIIILGANRRFLFVFQEDHPSSPLRRELVTDYDPARNLAPLTPPPVRAEPPPPDPPAK